MAQRHFDVERVAANEGELRAIFAQSAYAEIEPVLRFEPYFPRSLELLLGEAKLTSLTGFATMGALGVLLGSAAISFWKMSAIPLILAFFSILPIVVVIRMAPPRVFKRTSEEARYIELVCFDARPPVVYLRRFEKEDPPLPCLTAYNHLSLGLVNRSGREPLENLAHVLNSLGPVLGLGRPADKSIEHRISRLYTGDEHWQDVVRFFLRNARAVLMCYEPSPIIDWELQQSLQSRHATIYLLVRGLPRDVVRNREAALAAMPAAVQALECPKQYEDKVSDSYFGTEHGLLVVVAADAVKVYGIKVHYQQLWTVLFWEMARTDDRQTKSLADFPAAYQGVGRALLGRSAWWEVLAGAIGFAAGVWASLSTFVDG